MDSPDCDLPTFLVLWPLQAYCWCCFLYLYGDISPRGIMDLILTMYLELTRTHIALLNPDQANQSKYPRVILNHLKHA